MYIAKRGAFVLAVWLLWLGYLALTDTGAFWISLVLVPIFGAITWSAIRSRNIVLQAYAVFMFVAHAIGAPFLWLSRSNYGSGFGSVGNFEFDLAEFFLIYVWVVTLYAALVWGTRKLDVYIKPKHGNVPKSVQQTHHTPPALTSRNSARIYGALLIGFIIFIMVPLNVFMAYNNIGTLGLLRDPLPYRLTGILYYTRLYFGPLLIVLLFSKSNRNWKLVAVILGYAFMAGLGSASRTVLLISMFPVGYFATIDRQQVRLGLVVASGVLGFLLTSGSRDYTFSNETFVFGEAFGVAFSLLLDGHISVFDAIGGIANRFYGAQDMILAYQYIREDNWTAMANYFMSGGRANSVVPDLGRDFFNMNLEGTGFGVGIGTMAYLLILSHSNILVMPFAILIQSFLISAGNKLLMKFLARTVATNLVSHSVARGPLQMVLGGYMGFSLYSSSINNFYFIAQLLLIALLLHSLFKNFEAANRQYARKH
jgi:hypothetical protein